MSTQCDQPVIIVAASTILLSSCMCAVVFGFCWLLFVVEEEIASHIYEYTSCHEFVDLVGTTSSIFFCDHIRIK